jgi:septum formation inhibitor MinC
MKYEWTPGTLRGTELAGTNCNVDCVAFASNLNRTQANMNNFTLLQLTEQKDYH